jgi:hypothetical protein
VKSNHFCASGTSPSASVEISAMKIMQRVAVRIERVLVEAAVVAGQVVEHLVGAHAHDLQPPGLAGRVEVAGSRSAALISDSAIWRVAWSWLA